MSARPTKADFKARAAAASAAGRRHAPRTSADADPAPSPAPADHTAPRTRPVKITVEMSPIEHRKLRQFCATTAADLDLSLVAGAEVLRVLWQLAQTDPELTEQVRAELARTGGSRRR